MEQHKKSKNIPHQRAQKKHTYRRHHTRRLKNKPYDIRDIIKAIVDNSDFLEIQEFFAANIVIGFGRLNGETVGFVANQPLVLAGVLDCDSSDKAARFIRYCDSFNIPIVTLEDMPGYLPGIDQEHAGVIRTWRKGALRLL